MSKTSNAVKSMALTWPEREITRTDKTNVSEHLNETVRTEEYCGDIPGTCSGDSIAGVIENGVRKVGGYDFSVIYDNGLSCRSKSGKDIIDWCEDFGLMGNAYVFNVFRHLIDASGETGDSRLQAVMNAKACLDRYVKSLEEVRN